MAVSDRTRLSAASISDVSFLISLPLVLSHAVVLLNAEWWNTSLSYGLVPFAVLIGVVLAAIMFVCERMFRRGKLEEGNPFPWFTLATIAGLVFFQAPLIGRTLIERVPSWCIVDQFLTWQMTDTGDVHMRLSGFGNRSEHEFVKATVTWGEGLRYSQELDIPPTDEQINALRTELPTREIFEEIASLLSSGKSGGGVQARTASDSRLRVIGRDHLEFKVDRVLWIMCLVLLFQIIGHLTMRPG